MVQNTYQIAHYARLCIAERMRERERERKKKRGGKKRGIECLHLISVADHLFVVFKKISDH